MDARRKRFGQSHSAGIDLFTTLTIIGCNHATAVGWVVAVSRCPGFVVVAATMDNVHTKTLAPRDKNDLRSGARRAGVFNVTGEGQTGESSCRGPQKVFRETKFFGDLVSMKMSTNVQRTAIKPNL
jgi:hypothetical protein